MHAALGWDPPHLSLQVLARQRTRRRGVSGVWWFSLGFLNADKVLTVFQTP